MPLFIVFRTSTPPSLHSAFSKLLPCRTLRYASLTFQLTNPRVSPSRSPREFHSRSQPSFILPPIGPSNLAPTRPFLLSVRHSLSCHFHPAPFCTASSLLSFLLTVSSYLTHCPGPFIPPSFIRFRPIQPNPQSRISHPFRISLVTYTSLPPAYPTVSPKHSFPPPHIFIPIFSSYRRLLWAYST